MPQVLYLDTARLGQMSPRARRASVDFARFASECGGSLYFSDFLSDGYSENLKEFEQLRGWKGIAGESAHIAFASLCFSKAKVRTLSCTPA